MSSTNRDAFEATLREAWHPALEALGFRGDGERFQRELDDVVQAIGVQAAKGGGSVCVNLGVQPWCLPRTAGGPLAPGEALRVESCEFQWRLTPEGHTDYWWAIERGVDARLPATLLAEVGAGPEERAHHLAATFADRGAPTLERLSTLAALAASIRVEDLAGEGRVAPHYTYTPARAALTLARLHAHLGDAVAARRFAEAGLPLATKARKVRADLEALLAA